LFHRRNSGSRGALKIRSFSAGGKVSVFGQPTIKNLCAENLDF
jgi:hypothetical protein